MTEALRHAGIRTRTRVNIEYLESGEIESNGASCLHDVDAILVPGGFGERGIEAKIRAVQFAARSRPYSRFVWECMWRRSNSHARAGLPGAHRPSSTERPPIP